MKKLIGWAVALGVIYILIPEDVRQTVALWFFGVCAYICVASVIDWLGMVESRLKQISEQLGECERSLGEIAITSRMTADSTHKAQIQSSINQNNW